MFELRDPPFSAISRIFTHSPKLIITGSSACSPRKHSGCSSTPFPRSSIPARRGHHQPSHQLHRISHSRGPRTCTGPRRPSAPCVPIRNCCARPRPAQTPIPKRAQMRLPGCNRRIGSRPRTQAVKTVNSTLLHQGSRRTSAFSHHSVTNAAVPTTSTGSENPSTTIASTCSCCSCIAITQSSNRASPIF